MNQCYFNHQAAGRLINLLWYVTNYPPAFLFNLQVAELRASTAALASPDAQVRPCTLLRWQDCVTTSHEAFGVRVVQRM